MATSSHRPRRTRIYDANYDAGERLYKKQLDEIDNKRYGRASTPITKFTPISTNFADEIKFREPLFKNNIAEERSSLFNKRATSFEPTSDFFDDEFGSSALSKKISSMKFGASDDADFGTFKSRSARKAFDAFDMDNDDSFGSIKKDIKKRFDAFDADKQADEAFVSRKLKIKTGILKEDHGAEAEQATQRMKATKSRLSDLESEMMDMSMRHVEREKRNHDIKKLLSDCDLLNDVDI